MRLLCAAALFALAAAAPAQEQSARQLYYAEDDPPAKPVPAKPGPAKPGSGKSGPPKPGPAKPQPSAELQNEPNPVPGVQHVSSTASPPPRIGLRYSLLLFDAGGNSTEVSADRAFRSGDIVGVRVEVNRDGFLYVVAKGTSGNWKLHFPSPEINGGENRVIARRPLQLPSEEIGFVFDDRPGEEQLFVVYSAEPVHEIDSLIYSLREPANPNSKLLAQNAIVGNHVVASLRQAISRDLVIQKIVSGPGDSAPENAVYVISPNTGRLIADIRLTHQ